MPAQVQAQKQRKGWHRKRLRQMLPRRLELRLGDKPEVAECFGYEFIVVEHGGGLIERGSLSWLGVKSMCARRIQKSHEIRGQPAAPLKQRAIPIQR